MTKVLITGGSGFIGYFTALRLAEKGYEITLADNGARGRFDEDMERLISAENVRFENVDVAEPSQLAKLGHDFDYIYHYAAVIGVRAVEEKPDQVLSVNARSILAMLEYARDNKSLKKFLFSSTSEAYAGTLKHFGVEVPTSENVPLALLDVEGNRTTYALSKIFGESACHMFQKIHGVPTTIVRYHNVYGPRMGFMHVVPEMFVKIKDKPEIDVASPNHTRAFCYIDDAVDATIDVCEKKSCAGKTYHVGNADEEITIKSLVEKMAAVLDKKIKLNLKPEMPGSPARRCPDTSLLKEDVSYTPKVDLDEGLRRTYAWYKDKLENRYE